MTSFRPRAALLATASALALTLTGTLAVSAEASTPARVALPSPNFGPLTGTATPVDAGQSMPLRVYLSGRDPRGWTRTALAVSDPTGSGYARYLTPAEFEQRFGPTTAQVSAVTDWLKSEGMKVTAANENYLAVSATVGRINAAFDTTIDLYTSTVTLNGQSFTSTSYGASKGFSVPASVGSDIATVTGLPQSASEAGPIRKQTAAHKASPEASAATAYQCSQYWGQHTEKIPAAYGRTTAPTQLCGYTVRQMRSAYGISSSPYTGKGATIAVVLDGYLPSMLTDANKFFAGQGVPGFAAGQYSENLDKSAVSASCGGGADVPEEPLDVETAHIAAPSAKVVYFGVDCGALQDQTQQNMLDAMTKIVDQHLADVVTESYSINESSFSPADAEAWTLTFEQGATEGIGFNFDSGDGGDSANASVGQPAAITFPASDPWATAVGGTSLEIGANGHPVAEYGWGDNGTQVDAAGTGYTATPPGQFMEGSTGGVSTLFTEPAYQDGVVPAALATKKGTEPAHRTTPDIAADAGSNWLIGYTGANTDGVYGLTDEGGTSGASPLVSGLEADAKQASGHAVGFANPALYRLGSGKGGTAIHDVLPIDAKNPPMVIGAQPYFGSADDYLTTLGEDSSLVSTRGYDDVTGLGAATPALVTAFGVHR